MPLFFPLLPPTNTSDDRIWHHIHQLDLIADCAMLATASYPHRTRSHPVRNSSRLVSILPARADASSTEPPSDNITCSRSPAQVLRPTNSSRPRSQPGMSHTEGNYPIGVDVLGPPLSLPARKRQRSSHGRSLSRSRTPPPPDYYVVTDKEAREYERPPPGYSWYPMEMKSHGYAARDRDGELYRGRRASKQGLMKLGGDADKGVKWLGRKLRRCCAIRGGWNWRLVAEAMGAGEMGIVWA